GPDVEHALEEAGEPARVVDLVRVVRPTGGHHPHVLAGLLRHDLRGRVGHREHDRVAVHRAPIIHLHDARAAQADEHIGAHHGVAHSALAVVRVGVVGEPLLHGVHVLGAAAIEGAGPVARDDVACALQYEQLGGGGAAGY